MAVHPLTRCSTFEFAPHGGLDPSLCTFRRTCPSAFKHRPGMLAKEMQPTRRASRIGAQAQQTHRGGARTRSCECHICLVAGLLWSRTGSKSQKRHRMLSSRLCGVATSVTLSPKLPFTSTTSPRATILSPTTRSTGSET